MNLQPIVNDAITFIKNDSKLDDVKTVISVRNPGVDKSVIDLVCDEQYAALNHASPIPVADPITPESTQPMSLRNLQNASELAALGIPIIPIPDGQKGARIKEWPFAATNDTEGIKQLFLDHPSHTNYGLVAKAVPGGFLFLDDDGGIRQIFEERIGPMQKTRKNESCSGGFHYLYKHTDRSIALQKKIGKAYINVPKADGSGELWSLRWDDSYVLGPGSVAPKNKTGPLSEYKTSFGGEIIPIPDDLLAFLVQNYEQRGASGPVQPQSLTATPASVPVATPGLFAPVVGVDVSLDGPQIAYGSHDTELARCAGWLRQVEKLEPSEIEDRLIAICEARCTGYKSDYLLMCAKIAKSIGKKEIKETTTTPVAVANVVVSEESEYRDDFKLESYPRFPDWVMRGTSLYEGFVKPYCDQNSRYERYMFMPAVTMLLNYVALKVHITLKNIIPSVFMVSIGKPGETMKTASAEDAMHYFNLMGLASHFDANQKNAAGQTLIFTPASPEGLGPEVQRTNCKNFVLFYDELSKMVSKAGIQNSSLSADLLTLAESGKFSNMVKSRKDNYSLAPGSYCASFIAACTDSTFEDTWSKVGGKSSGLDDRFFFVLQPDKLDKERKPQTAVDFTPGAMATRKLIDKAVSQGSYRIADDSGLKFVMQRDKDRFSNRDCIRVEKFALYFAIDLGLDEITEECIERAIALVAYGRAVKRWLNPYEAETIEGRVQKKIISLLRKSGGEMSYRKLHHDAGAASLGTSLWARVCAGLKAEGHINISGAGTKSDPRKIKLIWADQEEE